MVPFWRERHGLCKSHFVERNWYMFPAKIFPAEIFPQFVQTQHSRTLPTDQKSKSRRPPATTLLPYTQHAPRPSCRCHPNSTCGCPNAPQWHPAEAIFHRYRRRLKNPCQSQPTCTFNCHLPPTSLPCSTLNLMPVTLLHPPAPSLLRCFELAVPVFFVG